LSFHALGRRLAFALTAAAFLAACSPHMALAKTARIPTAGQTLANERLEIVTEKGRVRLQVEVARNDRQREIGLMFRRTMAPDHGMLFDFKTPQPVYFWMKNTYLPLDMLFIDASGRVVAIAANAAPFSEAPIGPGVPVLAVLELNAGRAAQLGVKAGDVVRHRIFKAG
jgi:uncharacterized membrane protein (UPF0127 family)